MQKLLAANRGEIATRIMRAATELGLRTATIYSNEDRLSLHRFKADEAYEVGGDKGPVAAYLDIEGIVALAKDRGIDAIHPGYGFLSENSKFARACAEAGITFVGPPPELLDRLGDKTEARKIADEAGVPIIPGTGLAPDDPQQARLAAEAIGYPLIVKASFGGGGRGMRVVHGPEELAERLERGPNRGPTDVRRRLRVLGEVHLSGAAHRSADPRRLARIGRPSLGARLLCPAAAPKGGGTRPCRESPGPAA